MDDFLAITGIATALATSLTLLANLWWRRVDRREADWIAFDARAAWNGEDRRGNGDEPHVSSEFANVGDAAAYRVRTVGFGCNASFGTRYARGSGRQKFDLVPAIAPGERVDLTVWCDPKDWDEAFVVITWIASPTRRRRSSRRAYRLPLAQVHEPPTYRGPHGPFDEKTGQYLPGSTSPPAGWSMPDRLAPQRPLPSGRPAAWANWRTKRYMRRKAR